MRSIRWTIKNIVEILQTRQKNEFDANFLVSGSRGDGKSSLIFKALSRIKGFNPWKHQVYKREDVMGLLKTQQFGICWDDEAVNSGYKRDFQQTGQKDLIKYVTAYRDNFNIYASAIPNFFSLDKDLRDLVFLHLHVIQRGIAVVHMPLQGRLYSQDRWDSKYNAKIEEKWSVKMQTNPSYRPPYHKLTTFRGYLFFKDLTDLQKKLYKQIKKDKREDAFSKEETKKESFVEKIYKQLVEGKLTSDGILQMCLMEGKKYSIVTRSLNQMLKDNGEEGTVTTFVKQKSKGTELDAKITNELKDIIPSF